MDKILELIKNQKFDMDDLSNVLNVTKDTLGQMLSGKVEIKASQLTKIADYLNLDITGLLDGVDLGDVNNLLGKVDAKDAMSLLGNVADMFGKK